MKTVFCLIVLSIIVSGCFSSTLVTPSGENGDLSYPQFNEKFRDDEVNINLKGGRTISGESIYLSHDTVSWLEPNFRVKISVPVDNVHSVVKVNHTVSALLGLAVGGAVGVIVAISGTSGPQHDGGGAGFYWVIAPPSGAVIGVTIGAVIGSPSRYEFRKDTTSTHSGNNK